MLNITLTAVLPAALVVLLACAAGAKLARPDRWSLLAARIDDRRLPRRGLTFGIPAAELTCAALLLAAPHAGLAATSLLLAVLGAGVLHVRGRLAGEACGCLGPLAETRIGTPLAVADLTAAGVLAVAATVAPLSRPT